MLVKDILKICAACLHLSLQWQSIFKQCTVSISHSLATQAHVDYFPCYFNFFE